MQIDKNSHDIQKGITGGQEKVRDTRICITDEQAKVCHDKGLILHADRNSHDIQRRVTGGQEKIRDTRTGIIQTDSERFVMTKGVTAIVVQGKVGSAMEIGVTNGKGKVGRGMELGVTDRQEKVGDI
jgi:hypothetical protein